MWLGPPYRHSDNFHVAVDAVLASGLAKEEKRAVKEFLHLSVASVQHHLAPDSQATLALRLHHRKATVRMTAVKYVLDNLNTVCWMAIKTFDISKHFACCIDGNCILVLVHALKGQTSALGWERVVSAWEGGEKRTWCWLASWSCFDN